MEKYTEVETSPSRLNRYKYMNWLSLPIKE
jgi:hypothetical protein